ncbi:spore coat protein CotJB [Hathewaya massiliensis]|uniref:spore coat protein CotJB n=1 Tax=Hathewaya massiliensis TaxID=1964382 RepID=UPI003C12BFD4
MDKCMMDKCMMDDHMSKKDMMRKIQELSFVLVDLNLYLDNFPKNEKALMQYNMYSVELMKVRNAYERKHGPLVNFGFAPSKYPWQWIDEPWPWE